MRQVGKRSRPQRRRSLRAAGRSLLAPAQLTLDIDLGPLAHGQHAPAFRRPVASEDRTSPEPGHAFELSDVAAAVGAFHAAFNLPRRRTPSLADVPDELAQLRLALLREEVEELAVALQRGDLVALADALADVVYVAYGTAITYGIDLDAVLGEVHRANMSKLGPDGRPVLRGDGKVLKSPWYLPPDVRGVLDQQLPLPPVR